MYACKQAHLHEGDLPCNGTRLPQARHPDSRLAQHAAEGVLQRQHQAAHVRQVLPERPVALQADAAVLKSLTVDIMACTGVYKCDPTGELTGHIC